MLIGIIGGNSNSEKELKALDDKLEELIETSQCFLFNVAVPSEDPCNQTLGYLWASRRGCPIKFMSIEKILAAADYIVFILSKEKEDMEVKRALMKYKMSGKHGSVIRIG